MRIGAFPRSLKIKAETFPVIARSASDEAIHPSPRGGIDCFASLAMTVHLTDQRRFGPHHLVELRFKSLLAAGKLSALNRPSTPRLRSIPARKQSTPAMTSGTMDCFCLRLMSYGGQVATPVIVRAFARLTDSCHNDKLPFLDATN